MVLIYVGMAILIIGAIVVGYMVADVSICPHCGADNPPAFPYCQRCGRAK